MPDGPVPHCILLTRRKTLSAGLLKSELAFAAVEQESSLRFCNVQLQKFLVSKGVSAFKVQFYSPTRPTAAHSGTVRPRTLREESAKVWCELGIT